MFAYLLANKSKGFASLLANKSKGFASLNYTPPFELRASECATIFSPLPLWGSQTWGAVAHPLPKPSSWTKLMKMRNGEEL
jgi:hypothetical protein